MFPFGKRYREQQELELKRKQEEEAERERKKQECKIARETIFDYSKQLGFPSEVIDVRFYNHLFGILVDQQRRIEQLEETVRKQTVYKS